MNPNTAAILGALVADAAALGLHWLYDPARIKGIEAARGLVFLPPDAANYAGAKGYFAHAGKTAGEASGYGEVGLLMLKHLAQHGGFQRVAYQTEYRAHFGPGGAYVGYIDAPTRFTLRTLLPLEPEAFPAASGADDDQLPALAALPALVALVATHCGSLEALLQGVEEVVRVTNHNDLAVTAAHCAAAALFAVLHGAPMAEALAGAIPLAGDTLGPLLEEALTEPARASDAVAERFGRACHVTQGLPVIFHIARHAPDFRNAIEANIRAGGDSCGRAILLGALMAARQRDTVPAIPLPWLARYRKLVEAADACAALETHAI